MTNTPWIYSWRYKVAKWRMMIRLKQIEILEKDLHDYEELAIKRPSEIIRVKIRDLRTKIDYIKSDLID